MCGVVKHLCTHCGWSAMVLPVVFFVSCPVPESSAGLDFKPVKVTSLVGRSVARKTVNYRRK
jgi:hypothetical protein